MTEEETLEAAYAETYKAYLDCECEFCSAWATWIFGTPTPKTRSCTSWQAYYAAETALEHYAKTAVTPERLARDKALAEWTACECADCERFMAGMVYADQPVPKVCPLWRAFDEAETAWNRSIELT